MSVTARQSHHRHLAVATVTALGIGIGLVVTGCGDDEKASSQARAAVPARDAAPARNATVRVDAGEYYFRAPSRLAAGPTTFELRNVGRETHQLAIARLAPGVSVERAIAAGGEGGTAVPLGEVVARPGVTAELYANLRAGRHVLLCFEEDGGQPHLVRGQRATIVVK